MIYCYFYANIEINIHILLLLLFFISSPVVRHARGLFQIEKSKKDKGKPVEMSDVIVYENGSYRLSEEYRSESAERLKGLNMNHLKLVSDCFHKNGYINRSLLKKVFQDMLSEKQIRSLIAKMENAGIIQKDGAGKYTRYVKAPDFPSFV